MEIVDAMWDALTRNFPSEIVRFGTGFGVLQDGKRVSVKVEAICFDEKCSRIAEFLAGVVDPHVVRVFLHCEFQWRGKRYLAIVKEDMTKDLKKEVELRRQAEACFTFQELKKLFEDLICTFAMLEEMKIAHSAICWENVFADFINTRGLIVDNFWDGLLDVENTTTEHPLPRLTSDFFPPALRQYASMGAHAVSHNPFKSDVYALGMLFHHLITYATNQCVNSYEEQWLPRMMTVDFEPRRPTFIELRDLIQGRVRPQPIAIEPPALVAPTVAADSPKENHAVSAIETTDTVPGQLSTARAEDIEKPSVCARKSMPPYSRGLSTNSCLGCVIT